MTGFLLGGWEKSKGDIFYFFWFFEFFILGFSVGV